MEITYSLKRSRKRKKTISLHISSASEVTICAPHFTPAGEINRFVEEKQNWIAKAIEKHAQALLLTKEKDYVTGDMFYYLGQAYPLEAFFEPLENVGVVFWKERFFLNCRGDRDMRRHYFVLWYKKKAKEHLADRVEHFRQKLDLHPRSIRITSAHSRWGSCSADDSLAFSFRLMMAPPDVIDYVVVHELMHIRPEKSFFKILGFGGRSDAAV